MDHEVIDFKFRSLQHMFTILQDKIWHINIKGIIIILWLNLFPNQSYIFSLRPQSEIYTINTYSSQFYQSDSSYPTSEQIIQ